MSILFAAVLCIVGFVLIARQTIPENLSSSYRTAALVILALVYACFVGALTAISFLYGDPGLVLYLLFWLCALAEVWSLSVTVIKYRHTFRGKYVVLFFLYVLVILLMTLLSRSTRSETVLQTELFAAVKAALQDGAIEELNHMILNVILFLPLGYLFVQMNPPKLGHFFPVLGVGALFSTLIETCQLLFRLGNCDVDDILANTIGTVLGLFLYRITRRLDR